MPLNFPSNPQQGQIYSFGSNTYVWSGTMWESANTNTSAVSTLQQQVGQKVNAASPVLSGSVNIQPSTPTDGIKISGMYSWLDIIGDVTPKVQGASAVTLEPYRGGVYGWAHPISSGGDLSYHIPHEYVLGSDVFLHLHWGHNGTNISGSVVVTYDISLSQRTTSATTFSQPITITQTLPSLNITNSPRWCHRVDEIQISNNGGTNGLLNSQDITVDGLVLVHYTINTIPSITGSTAKNLPYLFTADMHIQTNIIGTKNKDPNFYA